MTVFEAMASLAQTDGSCIGFVTRNEAHIAGAVVAVEPGRITLDTRWYGRVSLDSARLVWIEPFPEARAHLLLARLPNS